MVVFQSLLIMESSAIPCKKIDQIQEAIHQLIESKQPSATLTSINGVDDEHQQLIKLISQVNIISLCEIQFCYNQRGILDSRTFIFNVKLLSFAPVKCYIIQY